MDVARPAYVPDPALSRPEMESLQRDIAADARFLDDHDLDGDALSAGRLVTRDGRRPVIAGVDQAFVGDTAVSAIVVSRDGAVVERCHAAVETEIPYVPGLLAFREGEAILAAFERLDAEPDAVLVDGSGRIHYREAGLATHLGVALDVPTVGVAKRLLCGAPEEPTDGGFPEGRRVPIRADDEFETVAAGTVVGHAVQTRQFESATRHVNPLCVSPGHRFGADRAADLVAATVAGYKLPEPTRRADRHADEIKARVAE